MLQIDLEQVKHAVSVFIRLGFARKKNVVEPDNLHPSWSQLLRAQKPFSSEDPLPSPDLIPCLGDENGIPKDVPQVKTSDPSVEGEGADQVLDATASELASPQTPFFSPPGQKRIGFMFDSSLTAFLMMGNLSPVSSVTPLPVMDVCILCLVCVCVRACVCECMHACVCACVCFVCVYMCACVHV